MSEISKKFIDRAEEIQDENPNGAELLYRLADQIDDAPDESSKRAIVQGAWGQIRDLLPKDEQGAIEKEYMTIAVEAPDAKATYDAAGVKQLTLDQLMEAMGVQPNADGEYDDDARAAFTNPTSESFYLKDPELSSKVATAVDYLGLEHGQGEGFVNQELKRNADAFQRTLAVEGWGPDNSFQPLNFLASTVKGVFTPRIKEAQLAGRDITATDVAGDLIELGLSFIPGVGLVSKVTGKVVAKIAAKTIQEATPTIVKLLGKGVAYAGDAAMAPLGAEVADSYLYESDPYNDRSQFRWGDVATGTAAGAAFTGAVKGAGLGAKMYLERQGEDAAKGSVKNFTNQIARIGEKTDDLIAQQQAILDNRARLAMDYDNVASETRKGVTTQQIGLAKQGLTDVGPIDIIKAEDYRLLNRYVKELGKAKGKNIELSHLTPDGKMVIMEDGMFREVPLPKDFKGVGDQFDIVKADYATDGASTNLRQVPGTDYYTKMPEKVTLFGEGAATGKITPDVNLGGIKPDAKSIVSMNTPAETNVTRADLSQVVLDRAANDPLLVRKLDPHNTVKEYTRDAAFGAVGFKAGRPESELAGNIGAHYTPMDERERALQNRNNRLLRGFVMDSKSPEEKQKKVKAILDVQQYGFDRLPLEAYDAHGNLLPVYQQIYDVLVGGK